MWNGYCKRKHIRKIFNWIKNKQFNVKITECYNNSLGFNNVRTYEGIISEIKMPYEGYCEYQILITFKNGSKADIWLNTEYEFTEKFNMDRLLIKYLNSGPYCYFKIEVVKKGE